MIGKALIAFFGLFAAYTGLMVVCPGINVSQNQNQTNYIKAEEYLYSAHTAHSITVVGTSLSARLIADSLPGFYNLAFGGMSVIDGLTIVEHSTRKPRMLLIETNLFWKSGSARFLEPLFNPVNYYLKKYLLSFRSDKQPIALATAGLIRATRGLKVRKAGASDRVTSKEIPFQQKVFNERVAEYTKLPDSVAVSSGIEMLKTEIAALKKAGVEIVFIEMPINEELTRSTRHQYLSRAFRAAFPTSLYTYVPKRNWGFKTTDGIHLTGREAQAFSGFLRSWLQLVSSKDKQLTDLRSR